MTAVSAQTCLHNLEMIDQHSLQKRVAGTWTKQVYTQQNQVQLTRAAQKVHEGTAQSQDAAARLLEQPAA